MTFLDGAVIIGYFAVLSLMGVYFSRRQKSRAEYFLGDRRMNWFLVGGSVLATLVSTITYLSLPGEMIRYGIAFFIGYLVLPLMIPVTNRILIPVLRYLPITSGYEYLEKRFDLRVRLLASCCFLFKTTVWMSIIIYTASLAFTEMSGWNLFATILVLGLITTFYTSVGGFRTVIWTDNVQLWILLGGALAVPIVVSALTGTGPLSWWATFSQAGLTDVQSFSLDPRIRITALGNMIAMFFWYICMNGGDQMTIQRYLSTPSLRAARRSVWVFTLGNVVVVVCLMFCGLALFAFFAQSSGLSAQDFHQQIARERADRLLPLFLVQQLPAGLSGLILAALLAAAMSSLSSGINSICTVLIMDLERMGKKATLYADKWVAVLVGILATAMALCVSVGLQRTDWNLVEVGGRINHLLVGPLGVLFFVGILLTRATGGAVITGFAVATALSVFVGFGKEWFGLEDSMSFMWVVPVSFTVGFLLSGLMSFILSPPDSTKVKGLTLASLAEIQRTEAEKES